MRTLRAIAVAGTVAAGAIVITAGAASAWTGAVTVGEPVCVGQVKRVHVVVANHEQTPAMMQTSDDVQATIAGGGTTDFLEATKGQKIHVRLTWFAPDGVTRLDKWDTDIVIPTSPSDDCVPATTVPPTTTPVTEPPTTTPVTEPPTTIVCEDGNPPSIPVEDGSLVCPEFGAPPDQTVAPTAPAVVNTPPDGPRALPRQSTAVPAQLPTTGSSSTIVIVAGLGVLLVGAILLFAGRRGEA